MVTLDAPPLDVELAETAHWSEDPPINIEEQEFDMLAFELWHLGNYPDVELEAWIEDEGAVAFRESCL